MTFLVVIDFRIQITACICICLLYLCKYKSLESAPNPHSAKICKLMFGLQTLRVKKHISLVMKIGRSYSSRNKKDALIKSSIFFFFTILILERQNDIVKE
jgi:hypothetical protein